jgi:HlyD family secretion protein
MRKFNRASLMLLCGVVALIIAALAARGTIPFGLSAAHSGQSSIPEAKWAAAAPGRVVPKGREVRIVAPVPAQIEEVLVELNSEVKAGDLLIRLGDEELQAKLQAAKTIAALRAAERDALEVRGATLERRRAQDSLYAAEQNALDARMELDRLISLAKANQATSEEIQSARARVAAANEKLKLDRASARNWPAPNREEAPLAAARAEVAAASAALERMRIRAVLDGTVLQLNARAGEMAAPTSDSPLLVLGDAAHLQIRSEVEERDASKIHPGQTASVKSDAFPDRVFDARVSAVARALGPPQLTSRGQRKQTDVDVLEVILDLNDGVPLLPGMRVDVLFREAEAS